MGPLTTDGTLDPNSPGAELLKSSPQTKQLQSSASFGLVLRVPFRFGAFLASLSAKIRFFSEVLVKMAE